MLSLKRVKNFDSKSDDVKIIYLKNERFWDFLIQNHAFWKSTRIAKCFVIFWMQFFFNFWHVEENLNSKSKVWYFFEFKNYRVVYFSIQNLTRCNFSISKSCFLNRLFWFSLKYHQSVTNIKELLAGKWQRPGLKKFFKSVWQIFVSHFVLSFWLLRSLRQLGSWWVWWLFDLPYKNLFGIQKTVSLRRFYNKRF